MINTSQNRSGDFQSPEDINGERSSPLRLRWRTEFSVTITVENRVLRYDYGGEQSSPLRLRWRTEFSTTITVENGVRQVMYRRELC